MWPNWRTVKQMEYLTARNRCPYRGGYQWLGKGNRFGPVSTATVLTQTGCV